MKYTRYNKKKNNSFLNILFMGLIIVFVAFLIGTMMSRILFKDKIQKEDGDNGTNIIADKDNDESKKEESDVSNGVKLYSIQCGFFKEKANAEQLMNNLRGKYPVFLYEENDGFKLMVGIYEEEKCNEVMKKLEGEKLEPVRVSFDFGNDDLYNAEIGEISNANIKLFNKLEDDGVKSIPTEDIKNWIKELKEVQGEEDSKTLLQEFKDYTLNLPDEILKSDLEKYYTELFGMIKKFKK